MARTQNSDHAGMTITFHKARAGDVERGVVVRFEEVVTVPVVIDGRQAVAYIGVTTLGKFASAESATSDDLVNIAQRLDWATD